MEKERRTHQEWQDTFQITKNVREVTEYYDPKARRFKCLGADEVPPPHVIRLYVLRQRRVEHIHKEDGHISSYWEPY
jgi:hypothetical protein